MKFFITIWILVQTLCSQFVNSDSAIARAVEKVQAVQASVGPNDTADKCNALGGDLVITTPEDYVKALQGPIKSKKVKVKGLVGRVLKGKSAKDFETLSNDPTRKIIFLMGSDGLENIIGMSSDEMLVKIGYTTDYIERLKKDDYQFKLVVFKSQGDDGMLATWDNVGALVAKLYPEVAAKVGKVIPQLQKTSFSEIECQASSRFSAVDKMGKAHPDYIDEARLVQREGKPWEVRGFLYYQARLMELYAGDGFVRDVNGVKGLQEYIISNKPIRELPSAIFVDLK